MVALLGEYANDYSRYTPSYTEQTNYNKILSEGTDCKPVSQTSLASTFTRRFAFEPVYVVEVDGERRLVYNSNMMEPDKEYPVIWNEEHFVLIKTGSEVSIYKFYPEKQ